MHVSIATRLHGNVPLSGTIQHLLGPDTLLLLKPLTMSRSVASAHFETCTSIMSTVLTPKNLHRCQYFGPCSFSAIPDTLRACCLPETWWPFLSLLLQNRDTNSLLPGTANRTHKCFRRHVLARQGARSASYFKANENEATIASTCVRAYALTEMTTNTHGWKLHFGLQCSHLKVVLLPNIICIKETTPKIVTAGERLDTCATTARCWRTFGPASA